MQNHPLVLAKSLVMGIGYDDAEAVVRASKDPACVQAAKEIDAARERERADAGRLQVEMAGRLDIPPQDINALIDALAADPEAETWLLRRVNLTRAHGVRPPDDHHPVNE